MTAGSSLDGYTVERNIPAIIIDPLALFREGLRRVLFEAGFQPVWCSDRAPVGPVAELSDKSSPLLFIGTEIEEANVQITEVKRLYPTCRVVLLADTASRDHLLTAFRSGAYTFLPRGTSCEMLMHTIRLVIDGSVVLPSELVDQLLENRESQIVCMEPVQGAVWSGHGLSTRELMVMSSLREGLSNKEIARGLGITEATVKVHVKALLRKARVRNRTQLAMWAARPGLNGAAQTGDTASALLSSEPIASDLVEAGNRKPRTGRLIDRRAPAGTERSTEGEDMHLMTNWALS